MTEIQTFDVHVIQPEVEAALIGCGPREANSDLPDYVQKYKCVEVGRWVRFKVTLGCGETFDMVVGNTIEALKFCRRMCRGATRYLCHGFVVPCEQKLIDLTVLVRNCIREVVQAILERPSATDEDAEVKRSLRRRINVHKVEKQTYGSFNQRAGLIHCSYSFPR